MSQYSITSAELAANITRWRSLATRDLIAARTAAYSLGAGKPGGGGAGDRRFGGKDILPTTTVAA